MRMRLYESSVDYECVGIQYGRLVVIYKGYEKVTSSTLRYAYVRVDYWYSRADLRFTHHTVM